MSSKRAAPRMRFTLRTLIPILCLLVVLGLCLFVLVQQTISSFKDERVRKSMDWMANSVMYFCSASFDQLARIGKTEDRVHRLLKQADALEQIEYFVTNNEFEIVVQGEGERVVLSSIDEDKIAPLFQQPYELNELKEVPLDNHLFNVFVIGFDAWGWRIFLLKDAAFYQDFLARMNVLYIAFGIISLVLAVVVVGFAWERFRHQAHLQESNDRLEEANQELEARVQERTAQLEKASEAKSEFLAKMSHELRTPLNAIIGYTEMLQEEAEEQGREEFVPDLRKIEGAGRHLLALINDILDISKIEAGKMDLFLETFDIKPMVRDVVATVTPLAEHQSNRLEVHCPDDVGVMRADLTKVRQVLLNLLSNACKFTKDGVVTLRVARERQSGNDWTTFEVGDSGIGMTGAQMANLFQPFAQGDASTSRDFGGTGLGLAISQKFCQMMGGNIEVQSLVGHGSTFTAWLPGTVIEHETAQFPSAMRSKAGDAKLPGDAPIALVIDDDPRVHDLMQRFLRKHGRRVATAQDGQHGLQLARELRPSLIILDVLMPGMDGWAVLKALKGDPATADIPVIMVTIVNDKNLGYTIGASDYLTKPIDWHRLSAILKKYGADNLPDLDEPPRLSRRLSS